MRTELHDENQRLGESIGASYNQSDGRWYLNGVPLYHNGAEKGSILRELYPQTAQNELLIKAAAGEVVFTPPQIENLTRSLMSGTYEKIANIQPQSSQATFNFDHLVSVTFDSVSVGNMDEATAKIKSVANGVFDDLVSKLSRNGIKATGISKSL
jgi:hypothetical protein